MIPNRAAFSFRALVLLGAFLLVAGAQTAAAGRPNELLPATGPDDPMLIARLAHLGPGVNPEEARRVAETAYTTGRDLAREWRVVSWAGMQNFLITMGARKAGYCFQWANELLLALDAMKLRTLELHWAEYDPTGDMEHNVIVVTAKGQPFAQGILLDNWRHSGHLLWGPITGDPGYVWNENSAELRRRLQWRRHYARTDLAPERGVKSPVKSGSR